MSKQADWFLLLVVFLAGVGMLGIEMLMPRLFAPFFGTSQPVWAVVIGATLLYLAAGSWLGGMLADRWPDGRLLYRLLAWAGLLCGCIPLLARPVLRAAQQAFVSLEAGSFLAALGAALLLFAAPVTLMATVGPFAARLHLRRFADGVAVSGRTVGTISALSTLGSLVGTLLPVFVLVPWIGTERTLYLFAIFLIVLAIAGLRDWYALPMLAVVVLLASYTISSGHAIRAAGCYRCTLLAEAESSYNYIQVVRQETPGDALADDARLHLLLNEGYAFHSSYPLRYQQTGDPLDLLTGGGPWDYFAVAPYFYPQRAPQRVRSLAMLGAAAGTVASQFLAIYGSDLHVDGVEIDPRILEMGHRYFAMDAGSARFPNYHVYAQDARFWLASTDQTYDVIGVDAYHQPYIPFHLTTAEFFRETRAHLHADGVVVVNVARPPGGDDRLVNAIATTMCSVFPQVFIIDTRNIRPSSNAIVVGVNRSVGDGVGHFIDNAQHIEDPVLQTVMHWAIYEGAGPVREFIPNHAHVAPLTDDYAPVEHLIDIVLLDTVRRTMD